MWPQIPRLFRDGNGETVRGMIESRAVRFGNIRALPKDGPQNRLAMARWLVGPENPLTGRVGVNQIWEIFFGRGIVETSEDFGVHSSGPSHPDLLDWPTTEFVSQGWDQKAIQRLIVTSNTYRQASTVTPELLDRDPANMLFTDGPRFRVEAEMVRDIALAASGLLSTKIGGPPVMPPQPAGLWVFPGQDQERNTDLWIETGFVYLRSAERAVPESDGVRRPVSRNHDGAAASQQYAVAGADRAQRSGVLRSRAGVGAAHSRRRWDGYLVASRVRVPARDVATTDRFC
jgi:hypothetical protein